MFLWYDRENDNFVELETSHDSANSTVSVETTHFSEYMIVDSKMWFDNWKEIESDWKKHTQSTSSTLHVISPVATVVLSHCSNDSDPDFLNPDSESTSTTINHQTNYRTLICEQLIDSMSVLDAMDIVRTKLDIIHQSAPKYYHTTFSNDKDYLKQELEYYLEGSYFNDDITNEIRKAGASLYTDELAKDKKVKRIVFITDRDYYVSTDELIDYSNNQLWAGKTMDYYNIYKSVPIYFAYIGDIDDNKFEKLNLQKIAAETGGKVYRVATLNELYSELGEKNHVSNVEDYDKDGFSDMEETYGLIVDSSGTRYKTKYDKEDSDDDGLKDNEEISNNGWCEKEGKDHYGNRIYKRYHHMNSDPTKQDSDGDGYFDKNDPRPDESDVTITKLKNDYILIDEGGDSHNISFGGYQGWFEDGTDKGDFISHQGCGLIAASDLILYLSRKDKKFSTPLTDLVPKTDYISLEDYKKFVLAFDALYIRLKWYYPFGIGGINTFDRLKTSKLNDYFEDNYINLKANWGWVENAYFEKVLDSKPSLRTKRIKEMITNDIPAIISVGPGDGIRKYGINDVNSSKGNGIVFKDLNDPISGHYFTVTGIIEDRIKLINGDQNYLMYEISTWGGKYYVSELEIRYYKCKYKLPVFTNVMYLEET